MLYAKWMKSLDDLDTAPIKKARFNEFLFVLELGGGFISWKPGYWIVNLLYTLITSINMVYYVPCHVMSALHVNDLDEIGQYINYAGLLLIGQTTIVMMIYYQRNVIKMMECCLNGFYDYEDGRELAIEIVRLKNSFGFFKKLFKIVLPSYFGLIASSLMMANYIDSVFHFDTFVNASYVNEVYQNLPLKMWYFHPIETQFDKYMTTATQFLCCFSLAMAISCADLMLIIFGSELIVQLKILLGSCLDMDERADVLYMKRYNRRPSDDPHVRKNDIELMKCYKYCLKQAIEHHQVILRYSDRYKAFLNWPSGMVVLTGSITIAMSALCLVQGRVKPSVGLTSALLLCAEIVSMFVLCEIGQTVTDLSDEVFSAMYMFKWMDCSNVLQKDFIIMKYALNNPIVIMAGALTPLNRDTFNTILSSAYSYLNLVLAGKNGDG